MSSVWRVMFLAEKYGRMTLALTVPRPGCRRGLSRMRTPIGRAAGDQREESRKARSREGETNRPDLPTGSPGVPYVVARLWLCAGNPERHSEGIGTLTY